MDDFISLPSDGWIRKSAITDMTIRPTTRIDSNSGVETRVYVVQMRIEYATRLYESRAFGTLEAARGWLRTQFS